MNGDQKLHLSIYLLAGIGLIDSLYLSWVKLTHQEAFCGGSGDCATVASSPYSEIGGVPIALLGVGAYVLVLLLVFLETRNAFWRNNAPLLVFGLSLSGTIYSAYLTYLEIAVIHAICQYCVVSAVVMVLLLVVAFFRLLFPATESPVIPSGGG